MNDGARHQPRTPRAPSHLAGAWALYVREMRRQIRASAFSVVPPVLTSVLFAAVFDLAAPNGLTGGGVNLPGDMTLGEFLAPGLICVSALTAAFQSPAFVVLHSKLEGYIDVELMAPLSATARVLAHIMIGVTQALLVGVLVALAMMAFVSMDVAAPLAALAFGLIGAWIMAALGLAAGLWAAKWDSLSAVLTFVVTPLVFMSGAFAPVDRLPSPIPEIFVYNPIHVVVQGVRGGMTGVEGLATAGGAAALVAVAAALAALVAHMVARGYRVIP